ncbi:MAG: HAD-IIIA family hydrolase [Clostridium sp.]
MRNISLIALDVDGTLTDGKIYYDNNGNEMKAFNAKDGMAIAQAGKNGLYTAIVTGRKSEIVEKRGQELGVKYIVQGAHNKLIVIDNIVKELGINRENVLFIGDDINDLEVMRSVGLSGCPKDAVEEVLNISDFIASVNGGDGAVREIIEAILKSQGLWNKIVNNYKGVTQ